MTATPTFCGPLIGAGYAPGYKGNSSSKKGESKTEVFLSPNRVSLEFPTLREREERGRHPWRLSGVNKTGSEPPFSFSFFFFFFLWLYSIF